MYKYHNTFETNYTSPTAFYKICYSISSLIISDTVNESFIINIIKSTLMRSQSAAYKLLLNRG